MLNHFIESGNTIIITSNEPWGDVWYSKQHYANELVKAGNEVYFLNPPEKWQMGNVFSGNVEINKIRHNFFQVSYKNNLPSFGGKLRKLNDLLISWKLFSTLGGKKNIIFWLFDPFRLVKIGFFKDYYKIFHVVDDYSNHEVDLELARSSDFIIVTSPVSIPRYTRIHQNVINIKHGIAEDDKDPERSEVNILKEKWGKYIIYIGGINKHLNFPMLQKLAEELKDFKIVFLGNKEVPKEKEHKELMDDFFKKNNVIYPGLVHAKKLKNYIAAAHVCLIPYYPYGKSRAQTLKAINYLTQLKPMVGIELDDLKPFAENYIFMTEDDQQFIQHVKEILEGEKYINTAKAEQYRESIRYPNLIKKIFNHINEKQ